MSASNCTRPAFRHNKPGWYGFQRNHKMIKEKARVIFLGDSIVEGLARYPDVWDLLKPFNTVNCGIRGDSIQNLLWRVDHLSLPVSLRVAVLLCGTNNIQHDEPKDIAEGVIACGSKLLEKDFFIFLFMHFYPVTMTTHAESINSDLQRGLDRRLRHTQH